jgi:Na+/phosphate symporter
MRIIKLYVREYPRSIRVAFSRTSDPELEVVWQLALASIVFLVLAVGALANGVVRGGMVGGMLASLLCLLANIITGTYVICAVRKASGSGDDSRLSPS